MSKEKKNRSSHSIALHLNLRWLLRLTLVFILIDFFFVVLAGFFVIWSGERESTKDYILWQQAPELKIPGFSVNDYEEHKSYLRLPAFLFLYQPESSFKSDKYIGIDNSLPAYQNSNNPINNLKFYQLVENSGQKPLLIGCPMGQLLSLVFHCLLLLLTLEVVILIYNVFSGMRLARKILSPIEILTQQTSLIKNIPGSFSDEKFIGLQDLTGKLNRIDANKLGTRIAVDETQTELRELSQAINTMLERINYAYLSQAQFVSDASHELRTPIAVIQGYINLLDRWGKDDEKTLEEAIATIKVETNRMRKLVEDLLFLARGDNNRVVLEKETLNACQLLKEVYKETVMIDNQHRWILKSDYEELFIVADPSLIKQAIRIIIDNAIKYSFPDQEIILQLSVIDDIIKITVQDNGMGIPEERLPFIFGRFYRADPSRARNTGGSGLGLAIANLILHKHNGFFEVISREGIGTRMSICLPKD